MKILFYKTREAYGFMSNFAKYPITIDGENWLTSEHYYQAQKFENKKHKLDVKNAPSAKDAANIGRDRSRPLRPDWEDVKDDIMRKAVKAKFIQHEALQANLLNTGEAELIEHSSADSYWADAGDGSGKNMLGKILMEVRDELKSDLDYKAGRYQTLDQIIDEVRNQDVQ